MHLLIIFLLIVVVVWGWTNLTRRKPQVPFSLKRTPKMVILFRLTCVPLIVTGFWAAILSIASIHLAFWFVVGGLTCLVFLIGMMWGITNLLTFLYCPRNYWLWRRGGGDPWFDSLDPPFNNDDDLVRYQELYRERARQQAEMFSPPPPPLPDPTENIRI